MLPPPPSGSMIQSGKCPFVCSKISKTAVFAPSFTKGLYLDAAEQFCNPNLLHTTSTNSSTSPVLAEVRNTFAPYARSLANLVEEIPWKAKIYEAIPAFAAYAATEEPALPAVAAVTLLNP